MTDRDKLSHNRIAGIAVLIVAVVTVIGAIAIGSGWWSDRQAGNAREPMELRGHWLGMRLTGADSATARQLGIPPTVKGVVIAEVSQGLDSRALQAGLIPGDVMIRIDGREVTSLSELYTLSTKLDVARPLMLDILRRGQPLSLLVPPPAELSFQQVGGYGYPTAAPGRAAAPALRQ